MGAVFCREHGLFGCSPFCPDRAPKWEPTQYREEPREIESPAIRAILTVLVTPFAWIALAFVLLVAAIVLLVLALWLISVLWAWMMFLVQQLGFDRNFTFYSATALTLAIVVAFAWCWWRYKDGRWLLKLATLVLIICGAVFQNPLGLKPGEYLLNGLSGSRSHNSLPNRQSQQNVKRFDGSHASIQ